LYENETYSDLQDKCKFVIRHSYLN